MTAQRGVQSVERAFDVLEALADAGGELGLTELANASGLPLPTIHRLMRTLVGRGYARQLPSRRYALGPRLMHLGDLASQTMRVWVRPYLVELVERVGETANLAVLEGDEVVYVAQVPSRHSMRMFTEVGRRAPAHCTGVGKALLATLPEAAVRGLLARTGMPRRTDRTITDPGRLLAELAEIRRLGYAVDDGEMELGVRCIAVAMSGLREGAALSVSGPAARLGEESAPRIARQLAEVVSRLSASIGAGAPGPQLLPQRGIRLPPGRARQLR